MNELIERIGSLERDLVCEQGFAPLERVLPTSGLAGAQFHACLARQERKRLDVHAMLAWQDQDPLDLRARAAALRRALEAAAAFFSGRIIVTLFLVAKTPVEAQAAELALKAVEPGHFLEKIQIGTAGVATQVGQVQWQGRVRPLPGQDWFEEHFVSGGRHGQDEVAKVLGSMEEDEAKSRRFLEGATASPWATYFLILLNSFMFVMTLAYANSRSQVPGGVEEDMGHLALLVLGGNRGDLVFGQHQYWRLVASMFLHGGLAHLLMNMAALYSLGSLTERFTGPLRLLLLYFLCGICGSLLSAGLNSEHISVGASGAILGLAGALLATHWRRPKGFPKLLADRIYGSLIRPVAFTFILGVGLSLFNSQILFDNWAHLGGLSGGFALVFAWPGLMKSKGRR